MVDREKSELMIQEQALPEPRKLENLMLCNTRPCMPNFIDRNYCFRVSVKWEGRESVRLVVCMYVWNGAGRGGGAKMMGIRIEGSMFRKDQHIIISPMS